MRLRREYGTNGKGRNKRKSVDRMNRIFQDEKEGVEDNPLPPILNNPVNPV